MTKYKENVLRTKKREIQKRIFSLVSEKVIYCLAGPDVNEYTDLFPNDVNQIISYERDEDTYRKQVSIATDPRLILNKGTFYNAPIRRNAFYDVDLIGTVASCEDIIHKFKDVQFMLTLVNGRCKDKFKRLFEALEEIVVATYEVTLHPVTGNIKEAKIVTDKNRYYFCTYRDNCPMFVLFKIPTKYY